MIGNAMPFPLSAALARELLLVDFKDWKTRRDDVIMIDD